MREREREVGFMVDGKVSFFFRAKNIPGKREMSAKKVLFFFHFYLPDICHEDDIYRGKENVGPPYSCPNTCQKRLAWQCYLGSLCNGFRVAKAPSFLLFLRYNGRPRKGCVLYHSMGNIEERERDKKQTVKREEKNSSLPSIKLV
jgi:hypothetical protein